MAAKFRAVFALFSCSYTMFNLCLWDFRKSKGERYYQHIQSPRH